MNEAIPSTPDFDLSRCDSEPIRIPGSIQPFGFLLSLSPDLHILQASDNLSSLISKNTREVLGSSLSTVLGAPAAAQITSSIALTELNQRPTFLCRFDFDSIRRFDVLAHRFDGLLILEFDLIDQDAHADLRQLYRRVGDSLQKFNDATKLDEMCHLAAKEIREVSGFGRVMVYQFDQEGNGNVIAECRDERYTSYLRQRFPATDIPRQARELYRLNRIRLIQNANYSPAQLIPQANPLTGQPTDLSFASLRSVSPIHLQYMRNMGTLASMSVSLLVKGQLWGLISCHHASPRPLAFDNRTVCEQLGQILAMCIESREDSSELQFQLGVRRIMVSMLAGLTKGADFIDNMRSVFPELLLFARAGGVAVIFDDRVVSYGDAPPDAEIGDIVAWLAIHSQGDIFHTDQLGAMYPPGEALTAIASGLMAMPISRIHKHYLLWFRPETVYTVDWAGKPESKDGEGQLTPRSSFATWRETIHGKSAPWHPGEIELAVEFRTALIGLALERAEQMAELAEELTRSNKELEAFSYSVSHDLRAPLRHIVGYADLLVDSAGNDNLERRQRFLKNIKDSARLAGKLVDDLLSFSQMGRAALRPTSIQMDELVRVSIDKLSIETGDRNIEWEIGALPTVRADPNFIQLVLFNLLSNAVKFTSQVEQARIRIMARETAEEWIFSVADNGVGFNMDYVHKLFGVFQRLHRLEDFHGTGIGLANVRRIIERHEGRVWAESSPGHGATFSFSIPKELPF